MASEAKIDVAAQKAYEDAAAKQIAATPAAKPVATPAPAPVKAAAPAAKPAAKKVAAKKPAARKTTKKIAAKPAAAKVALVKPAPAKNAAPAKKPVAAKTPAKKDTLMTEAKDKITAYTAQLKDGIADLQTRAKAAYDKSSEIAAEVGEFNKGNVEAVVESAKIYAAGVQTLAKNYVEEGKTAVETLTADVKEFAAVKSPTEFVQLQGKLASRNFDAAVAQLSKNTEAWVKLANDTFAPLSNRVSLAIEKVRKAA